MRRAAPPWALVSTAIIAVALLFALPWLAASVVRGAIERDSAHERATLAAGGSPWSWRFRHAKDIVAGHAFGNARLSERPDGLQVLATDGSPFELGLVLRRQADIHVLMMLRLTAVASSTGTYGIAVRRSLDDPIVHASLGTITPDALAKPLRLDTLVWTDDAGRHVDPPTRAAMFRLRVHLPAGATLTLRDAALVPPTVWTPVEPTALPEGLSAEGLLGWRDDRRAVDPMATFGATAAAAPAPAWQPWTAPLLYLLLLVIVPRVRAMRDGPVHAGFLEALLVVAGPLWFIAGLGMSFRPAPPGIAMFAIGVGYALVLAFRRQLPPWHWFGAWRRAGWPLLALPVAIAIVAVAGHAPAWPPFARMLIYVGWAFFQQWLMLAVVAALLERAMPRPFAVLLTALAFALLHTPNGLLMQLCFVAELAWAWWFLHRRAVFPVALAHAASALLMQACLAGGILRSLEVSARFIG
jgi:hypothetical protein